MLNIFDRFIVGCAKTITISYSNIGSVCCKVLREGYLANWLDTGDDGKQTLVHLSSL